MSHGELINRNPDTEASSPATPSHANKSAVLLHSFRVYYRSIKDTNVSAFWDKAAKSTSRERCQGRLGSITGE